MSPQQSIGPYRIAAKIGEGGMGAVYRATDTRLNRDVAIKVLPETFRSDAMRMARFEREAQVLAALNHPNIASIYGVEQGAIVMELVPGEEVKGPAPVETVISYGKQLAAALEAAHEKGIVHRDLKPANIKVTPDGVLKVLDFGLAKAGEDAPASSATISPTLSLEMTSAGVILGTAAYMSPEQARGKPVDKRADIWSYGVVLFEMLTGTMLYAGETVSDSMIAVATKEPEWSALPKETPEHVVRLLRRCLMKDPRLRLRDIGEARIALEQPQTAAAAEAPAPVERRRRAWLPWTVAGMALAVAAGSGALWLLRSTPAEPPVVRVTLPLPEGAKEGGGVATPQMVPSPDGRYVVMVAVIGGVQSLWIRALDSNATRKLDHTEGANFPFWSPDGQYVAYFTEDRLKKVPVSGGVPQTVCTFNTTSPPGGSVLDGDGGAWGPDGAIVFGLRSGGGLWRVAAAGGPYTHAFPNQLPPEVRQGWPQFLPDGRHVLYTQGRYEKHEPTVYVQELGSPERVEVMQNLLRAAWAPPGYLLFPRDGTLYAQRLNGKYRLTGSPMVVAEDVTFNLTNRRAAFAVSGNGVLVYRNNTSTLTARLMWHGRDGKSLGTVAAEQAYRVVRLSPDGRTAALAIGSATGNMDLWTMDLASGVMTRRSTDGKMLTVPGAWSPDSQRFAVNVEPGDVREIAMASGQVRPLITGMVVDDWSPDGRFLIGAQNTRGGRALLALTLGESQPQAIHSKSTREDRFVFSPDGKYVAYISSESGGPQIVVASYPSFAEKRQVTVNGGLMPLWRKDGKELFLISGRDGDLMSAAVSTGGRLEVSVPKTLFSLGDAARIPLLTYAPAPDGQRFLVIERPGQQEPSYVAVVNWTAGLKRAGAEQ